MASTGDTVTDDLTSVTFTNKSLGALRTFLFLTFFDESQDDTIDLLLLRVAPFVSACVFCVTFHLSVRLSGVMLTFRLVDRSALMQTLLSRSTKATGIEPLIASVFHQVASLLRRSSPVTVSGLFLSIVITWISCFFTRYSHTKTYFLCSSKISVETLQRVSI